MSSKRGTPQDDKEREFPKRILIANIAHPDRSEYELEILSDDHDWGSVPVAPYERADTEARPAE